MQSPICLCSEELLGLHETIQIYSKLKVDVPLRLLHVNSLKHSLARDVSDFTLLLYRSFTKREGPVFCQKMLLSHSPVPGPWPTSYQEAVKTSTQISLTLFCVNITSRLVVFTEKDLT